MSFWVHLLQSRGRSNINSSGSSSRKSNCDHTCIVCYIHYILCQRPSFFPNSPLPIIQPSFVSSSFICRIQNTRSAAISTSPLKKDASTMKSRLCLIGRYCIFLLAFASKCITYHPIEINQWKVKAIQRDRAAADPVESRTFDFLREEIAQRLTDRLDVSRTFSNRISKIKNIYIYSRGWLFWIPLYLILGYPHA